MNVRPPDGPEVQSGRNLAAGRRQIALEAVENNSVAPVSGGRCLDFTSGVPNRSPDALRIRHRAWPVWCLAAGSVAKALEAVAAGSVGRRRNRPKPNGPKDLRRGR
jgi:hypothetical protein